MVSKEIYNQADEKVNKNRSIKDQRSCSEDSNIQ
jgi:hypothetical protein